MEPINLDNFLDPKFEDGKYILTSPRSLEACSNLGIKVTSMHLFEYFKI